MGGDFVGSLLDNLDSIGAKFSSTAFSAFETQIMPFINTLVVLYVIIHGVRLILGMSGASAGEVIVHLLKVVGVATLATNWSMFNELIYSWLIEVPDNIGQVILNSAGGSTTTTTNGLSSIVQQASTINASFNDAAGWRNLGPILMGFLVSLCAYILVAIALMLLMISKVVLWILVGLSPVFIACYLFSISRSLTNGWISQLLAYALIPVFTYSACAIIILVLKTAVSGTNFSELELDKLLSIGVTFVLISLAGLFILFSIQGIAQGVVGGIMLPAGNFASNSFRQGSKLGKKSAELGAKGIKHAFNSFKGRGNGGDGGSISNSSRNSLIQQVKNNSRPK